jgi:hypothetical protein
MKSCRTCGEEKPLEGYYRSKSAASGYQSSCKECIKRRAAGWYESNRERALSNASSYRSANREACLARSLDWARRNPQRRKEICEAYTHKHPERRAATKAKWSSENKGKHRHYAASRKVSKLRAMPSWANEFFIEEAYGLAALRTKITGIKWHVDHIVPLQSQLVCGLHVENNLRVIPAIENLKKHNKHWPDMPQ